MSNALDSQKRSIRRIAAGIRHGARLRSFVTIVTAGAHFGGVVSAEEAAMIAACGSEAGIIRQIDHDQYSAATMWSGFPGNCSLLTGTQAANPNSGICINRRVSFYSHSVSRGWFALAADTERLAQLSSPTVAAATRRAFQSDDQLAYIETTGATLIARREVRECR